MYSASQELEQPLQVDVNVDLNQPSQLSIEGGF